MISPNKKIHICICEVKYATKSTEVCFKFFFHIFNSQIWLNWVMDDPHFSYVTKLKQNPKKKLVKINVLDSNSMTQTINIYDL